MSSNSSASSSDTSSSSSYSSSGESSPVQRTLVLQDDDILFEGNDPNWPFKPPVGSVLLEHDQVDPGEFDWDQLHNNNDLELVLIRVPSSFRARHLEGTDIRISDNGNLMSGQMEHEKRAYKISSAGSTPNTGFQDLKALKVLLPRRIIGGQLQLTTEQVGTYLALSEISPEASSVPERVLQNPERPKHPPQMLSHRYVPFGVKHDPEAKATVIEVDYGNRSVPKSKKYDLTAKDGDVKKKSKKRKKESAMEDSSVPKKSKRAKQAA